MSIAARIAMFNTSKEDAPAEPQTQKVSKKKGTKAAAFAARLEAAQQAANANNEEKTNDTGPPKPRRRSMGKAAMFEAKIQAAKETDSSSSGAPSKPKKKGRVAALAGGLNIRMGPQMMKGPPLPNRNRGSTSESGELSELKFEKPTIGTKRQSRSHRDSQLLASLDLTAESKESESSFSLGAIEEDGAATVADEEDGVVAAAVVGDGDVGVEEAEEDLGSVLLSSFEADELMVMHPSLIAQFLREKMGMDVGRDDGEGDEDEEDGLARITRVSCEVFGEDVRKKWGLGVRCKEEFVIDG